MSVDKFTMIQNYDDVTACMAQRNTQHNTQVIRNCFFFFLERVEKVAQDFNDLQMDLNNLSFLSLDY